MEIYSMIRLRTAPAAWEPMPTIPNYTPGPGFSKQGRDNPGQG